MDHRSLTRWCGWVESRETGSATKVIPRLQPQGKQQAMRLFPAIRETLVTLLLVPFLSGCGILFVNSPPSDWQEIQDPDQFVTIALTQPCTSSRTLVWVDGVVAAAMVISATDDGSSSDHYSDASDYFAAGFERIFSVVTGVGAAVGAAAGFAKVNDCRAFNARLSEERRRSAQSQASYEWSDELFPIPDFRANAFFPVRSLNLNR